MNRRGLLVAIAAATLTASSALAQEPIVFGVITPLSPQTSPFDRLRVIAAAVATTDDLRFDLRPEAVTVAARSLLASMVDCLPRLRPMAPGTFFHTRMAITTTIASATTPGAARKPKSEGSALRRRGARSDRNSVRER